MKLRHYLRCLGHPALFAPTGEPIRIRTKKHLALLVYLAVEPHRAHRREDLAALLWPKAKPAEARHSLSTALSLFRARLGREAVEGGYERIALEPGWVVLDLDQLSKEEASDPLVPPLVVAAFLDGFDIVDAPDFAHWKDRQQARLLPSLKRALITLIDRHRRTGEFQQVEDLAERILALDDLSEEAIRAKLEACILRGDRITALRVYEDWRTKLASELQAEPSDTLQRMATQLRGRSQPYTTAHAYDLQPQKQPPVFIGRTAEYQTLYNTWEQTCKGLRTGLLVMGDSGIGKTTLVQRLRTSAALEGAVVSRVQCYEIERDIPYSTLATIVLDILNHPSASGTAPESLAELARITPEIRKRFPSIPTSTESQGEIARVRLTDAFLELLFAVSEQAPVLLITDDLHFADDASLAVLHLAIRRIATKPIMFVFVARTQELRHSPHASRLLNDTASLRLDKLEIDPLSRHESQLLLEALIPLGQPRPTKSVQLALLQAAAGYPMALELLVRDWHLHGHQSLALSISGMSKSPSRSRETISTYKNIFERVTVSLSSEALHALNLAAVLGHRLNDLSMYSLVGLNPESAASALAELTSGHILREGEHELEFRNELLRNAAYVTIASPIRKLLHVQIAEQLIRAPDTAGASGLEIAWHCIRGGRERQATLYLLEGANSALNRGALHAAEHALTTALPHLENGDRGKAILLLAQCLQEQGRWEDSLVWLSVDREQRNSDLGTILSLHASHCSSSHPADTMRSEVGILINILKKPADLSIRVKAARVASRFLPQLRDETTAIQLLDSIDALPINEISEQDFAEISIAKALCLYHAHRTQASLSTLLTTADRLRQIGHINSILCSVMMGLGSIKCQQGKYENAVEDFTQGYEIAKRIGNDSAERHTAAQLILCHCRLGLYEVALNWAERVKSNFDRGFSGYIEVQCAYYSALAHVFQGNTRSAATTIADLDDRIPVSVPEWMAQAWQLFKADVLYITGRREEAILTARDGLGHPTPTLHSRFFAGWFSRWLALTAKHQLEHNVARSIILEFAGQVSTFDALDQAEVVCAEYQIRLSEMSIQEKEYRLNLIKQKLKQLPPAVHHQLQALGAIQP